MAHAQTHIVPLSPLLQAEMRAHLERIRATRATMAVLARAILLQEGIDPAAMPHATVDMDDPARGIVLTAPAVET